MAVGNIYSGKVENPQKAVTVVERSGAHCQIWK